MIAIFDLRHTQTSNCIIILMRVLWHWKRAIAIEIVLLSRILAEKSIIT